MVAWIANALVTVPAATVDPRLDHLETLMKELLHLLPNPDLGRPAALPAPLTPLAHLVYLVNLGIQDPFMILVAIA